MSKRRKYLAVTLLSGVAIAGSLAFALADIDRSAAFPWVKGRQECEDGVESESASWYRAAQSARASIRASCRAEAADERLAVVARPTETAMKMHDAFASMLRDEAAARVPGALPMT
jgi:hypothetical protein